MHQIKKGVSRLKKKFALLQDILKKNLENLKIWSLNILIPKITISIN